ncbi:MAG: BMP family ABC transporter substrate-binding protein [Solobacterium sp.]|nr:BMP family ABC transporter substrate-binding protein [Solobacterium sp.]MDO4193458.1 BMP family ABC transporter substrate-binding protein [Erysipelotrichaceae bacterium]
MKKFVSLLLAGLTAVSMAACSSGGGSATPAPDAGNTPKETAEAAPAEETAEVKVAMITDYGDITDQSFNQTTYEAAKAYCDSNGLAFTYYKPAGDSTAEREAMIDKAVADGYNVLVMPGFAFAEAIAGTVDMYPDVKYVALDVSEYDLNSYGLTEMPENLFSAVYQEEIAGYFAGQAAVKLGYEKLGFLGGMAVPAVIRYGYGFVQGADDAAAELGKTVDIKYAYGNQFYGDADITAAMDTWYGAGTEVVFACGGGIYTSAVDAAKKVGAKVIGVDVDQAGVIKAYAEEDGMTVTSAMKGLAATVNSVLSAIKDGSWATYSGQIQNLGLVSGTDPAVNYVGLPSSTQWADGFTEADYNKLVADVFSGAVTVSNDTAAEPETTNANVDYQGNIK